MELRGITLDGPWRQAEMDELARLLRPLPRAFVEDNPSFRVLIRRDVLTNAPAHAPGHSKYEPQLGAIVVFDKGVYHGGKIDPEQFRRSVYHELAHSIIRSNPSLLNAWNTSTRGDGFVDDYAKTSPDEDFADTLSEFLIHNGSTKKVVPRKAAFLQKLFIQAGEKVAMSFMYAFADELTKTAQGGGTLKKVLNMVMRVGKSPAGKGAALAATGGAAGLAAGAKRGRESGYESGTKDVVSIAQRARMLGRREGVMAYHRHIQQQIQQSRQRG